MPAWMVHGVELPFGDEPRTWWLDGFGRTHDLPVDGAEPLPGRYVLSGLVDAHAHPAVASGAGGPSARDEAATQAQLVAWAESGITLVRDVGSPMGLTLDIELGTSSPAVQAAGRFLAPEGRYFPQLLVEPVAEDDLINAALVEIDRGARWVKVIGDFPRVPDFTETALTYPFELVARLSESVHHAGGRVAVHTTKPDAGRFVAAGVDSIEHGPGLDLAAVEEMGRRNVAWTPTLCALFAVADADNAPPERHIMAMEAKDRVAELLPAAVRCGVPVLAGTDVVGSIPREVALLAELGLDPSQALAAASSWARDFLGVEGGDIVTYQHDPREDPGQLDEPLAVVVRGTRLR